MAGHILTPEVAKKKINNLRTQYLDYRNKVRQSKSSGASIDEVCKPTWWLYEEMSFLDPHIAQRRGESSITISQRQLESSDCNIQVDEDDTDLQYLDVCNMLKAKDHDKEDICGNSQSSLSLCSSPTKPISDNTLKSKDYDKENVYQNLQSPVPSCSDSTSRSSSFTTPLRKRKKSEASIETPEKNKFWAMASNAIQTLSKSEEAEDGLKHWTLYLESELRKIKDAKKLKAYKGRLWK